MRIARTGYGHTLVFRDFCYFFGNQFLDYFSKALCWQCDESNGRLSIYRNNEQSSGFCGFGLLVFRSFIQHHNPAQISRIVRIEAFLESGVETGQLAGKNV
jgi:hypothetical protein